MLLVEARIKRPIEEFLHERYVNEKKMQREIADELGVDTSTVSDWLFRVGIDARSRGAGSIAEAAS